MKLSISTVCKRGGREYNQDYLAASVDGDTACLVVCDGLGSYVGSEVASNLCASFLVRAYKKIVQAESSKCVTADNSNTTSDSQVANNTTEEQSNTNQQPTTNNNQQLKDLLFSDNSLLTNAVLEAHNFVAKHKASNPLIKSSCTTMAMLCSDFEKTLITHIGDTRIYIIKKGKIAYQTRDHSLAQVAVDRGDIALSDIRKHKDQNKLTRVLGGEYFITPDTQVIDEPLQVGDGILICTDGWWEYVYDDEIEAIFKLVKDPQDALLRMERRLIKRAPPFNDNFSAIVAMVV